MSSNKDEVKIYNENHMENCNVFQGDIYGATFPLPGANVTINQYYGKGQKPKTEVEEGNVEPAEARERRKLEATREITRRFDFKDEMLGYDNRGRRITSERVAVLFSKCLGIGSYPSRPYRLMIEQVWVLLIDARKQCTKRPGEDYFRQTVLNIVGYFVSRGIICGAKLDIAQCIFADADANLARNIERNIESAVFPEGLAEMLDLYIEKLRNGEF